MKNSNDNLNNNLFLNILYFVIVIGMIIAIIAVSYAVFSYVTKGQTKNTITTGTLNIEITDEEGLELLAQEPLTDLTAESKPGYTFNVRNTGTKDATYRIYLIDDTEEYTTDGCTKISWSKLRYSLEKDGQVVNTGAVPDDGILYTTNLGSLLTNEYEFKIWIASTAGNEVEGQHFHGKIMVKSILQGASNFDTGE